jgi:hypothetical protein
MLLAALFCNLPMLQRKSNARGAVTGQVTRIGSRQRQTRARALCMSKIERCGLMMMSTLRGTAEQRRVESKSKWEKDTAPPRGYQAASFLHLLVGFAGRDKEEGVCRVCPSQVGGRSCSL